MQHKFYGISFLLQLPAVVSVWCEILTYKIISFSYLVCAIMNEDLNKLNFRQQQFLKYVIVKMTYYNLNVASIASI